MQLGFFGNPIFRGEQYPKSILDTMPGARRLNDSELKYINGTSDFFGIDPYTATVVSPADEGIDACAKNTADSNSLFPYCVKQETENIYGWNIGYRSGWFFFFSFDNKCPGVRVLTLLLESYVYITPTYFREYLLYLWNTFRHPVFVSEFGFPVYGEADKDLPDQLYVSNLLFLSSPSMIPHLRHDANACTDSTLPEVFTTSPLCLRS